MVSHDKEDVVAEIYIKKVIMTKKSHNYENKCHER